eukprot:CAMPEP_0119516176 /NCGR_PEP_ID=MMETSP1344-20130328/33450_1 /TAXON_ID=236787 /ORGANISM="Florenciella parvula, Strain CCMP2471" /LENGTH=49 /DNA_ID=CAMNT_0007553653 /DNA_START=71 /DNA_END=220 /DNA_ORIENTATION=-
MNAWYNVDATILKNLPAIQPIQPFQQKRRGRYTALDHQQRLVAAELWMD